MKIKLLKINDMKKFTIWLEINHVHLSLWDKWFWNDKVFIGLDKREREATERDKFCRNRKGFEHFAYNKINLCAKANQLLTYIQKRYTRK